MATSTNTIDPPYKDVFADGIADDNDKMSLLTAKWNSVRQYSFKSRYIGGTFRKLQPHCFETYNWLRFSNSTDGVFCAPCHLFAGNIKRVLVSTVATDISNLPKTLKKPSTCDVHVQSIEAAENYKRVMTGKQKDIASSMSSSYNALVEKNRQILLAIVDTVILWQTESSFKGPRRGREQFCCITALSGKPQQPACTSSQEWGPRTKYISPNIQNELIAICGDEIKSQIIIQCNKAPYFRFIADEAMDSATMEQMAWCLRYFDTETKLVEENFIEFAECKSTTGKSLSNAFLEQMRSVGVDLDRLRGQGYDGASNMSGKFRGEQARIREVQPRAMYTHCRAHCLNLAICHASEEPLVQNMMHTVQEVPFCFNYSAKRLLRFQEALESDSESRLAMEKRTKLQSLCERRWAARADALHTFRCSYTTVVEALDDLNINYGDTKAGPFKLAITQFGFIVTLVAIEFILAQLVPLSKMLQTKTCDLVEASKEASVICNLVQEQRNDDAVWDDLSGKAIAMATSVDVEPTRPRDVLRQQNRQNVPAATISEYWKRNMWLPFLDHLAVELTDRLLNAEGRLCAQYLLPVHIAQLSDEGIQGLYQTFLPDLSCQTFDEFEGEIRRWKTRCQLNAQTPLSNIAELYLTVCTCLHVLLSMPVSTAMAERSFSAMRRLKTYLRSTMSTERMSGLGLIHIHRNREIVAEKVVDIFARRKD